SASFTNTKVRLTDSTVTLNSSSRIGKSATQTGAYVSIGGTVSSSTITSDPVTSFSFFAIGTGLPTKYRSRASGNWNDFNTWQVDTGSGFVNAVSGQTPTTSDDTIEIQNNHTVTVTAGVNADQVTVDLGGTLTVNAGITLTIDDGSGTDLTVGGTMNVTGTGLINGGGSFLLASGGALGIGSANGITSGTTASG